ncbi:DUF4275 family protein [Planococcus sp. YIM B11945]|uniref:DUF4275 family protein n=1 Tax=Planococcus sp. YIM B11945 TaxID=3435410 RepID=UPI003D7DF569
MDELVQMQIKRLRDMNFDAELLLSKRGELEQRWEEAFAKDLSKAQKRKIAFPQCMWNAFSWNKIECLKEQVAVDAFNQQKKARCYLFYANIDDALFIKKANRIKAEDIIHTDSPAIEKTFTSVHNNQSYFNSVEELRADLYVVDEHFTWTYVLTHEEGCGPYFYKP